MDPGTRIFVFFLGFIITCEILGFLGVLFGLSPYSFLHIYTLGEFFFATAILAAWQSDTKRRKSFLFLLLPYFVVWVVAKFTFESFRQFDSYTAALAAVILIVLSAFTLVDLFSTRFTLRDFHRDPRFWICCTFLIGYAGSSLSLAMMNAMLMKGTMVVTFPINSSLNVVRYLGFTGGLLCFLPRPVTGRLLSSER